MRKTWISVLMIPLLLLAGCGEREAKLEERFAAFRDGMLEASEITLRAALTADYGGTVEEYLLDVSYDGRQTEVTVAEPSLIAGVTARARWGETELEYGGVLLGTGPLDEDGLTPVSALPVMLEAMAGGYAELLWWDGDYIAARLYVGETSRCTVWLDADTLVPAAAEIASEGRRVLSCTFSEWSVVSG